MVSPRGFAENTAAPPTVSVVVTTYRRPEQLRLCLQAIKNQIYQPLEIVLTEDCDDDYATRHLADSVVSHFFPGSFRYVMHPRTLDANGNGIWDEPQTVNNGVAAATGDYVLVMQDDCIIPPDFLLWLVRSIDQSSILYPVLEYTTHDRFTVKDLDALLNLTHIPDAEPRWQFHAANGRALCWEFTEWGMAEGVVWAFPRSSWIPLDENMVGSGFAEQDWALRQRLRGYHLYVQPLLRGWLRDWPGVVHPTPQDLESRARNKEYMEEKWGADMWTSNPVLPAMPFERVQGRVLGMRKSG